jgi:hypothetical protein
MLSHSTLSIPTLLADVNRQWFASALKVDQALIRSFKVSSPSSQRGYGGDIGFVSIDWVQSPATASLPTRLVIKLMPSHPPAAVLVRQVRSFEREARFYAELALSLPVRTPNAYYVNWQASSGTAVLMLEDCSHLQSFTFAAPPPVYVLELVVDTAVRLHAHWWGREALLLEQGSVLSTSSVVWQQWAGQLTSDWALFLDSPLVKFLPPGTRALCERLAVTVESRMTRHWPTRHLTLCHMDLHSQNIFFDAARPDDPIVIFDWDGCHPGCGAHDIAYFLALLPIALRRDIEQGLLRRYHAGLVSAGIADYSYPEFLADYQIGCLFNTFLIPMLLSLDIVDEASQGVAKHLIGGLLQLILDNDAQQLLMLDED